MSVEENRNCPCENNNVDNNVNENNNCRSRRSWFTLGKTIVKGESGCYTCRQQ